MFGLDDFFWRALLAGVGVACIAGPLGVFVVWRRMAYFGDTLSHSAILGVALGFLLGMSPSVGVAAVVAAVALLLFLLQRRFGLATDTLLGILAHGALSLGLVVLAFLDGVRIDLMSYLFGDLLSVDVADLVLIWTGGVVVSLVLISIRNSNCMRSTGTPSTRANSSWTVIASNGRQTRIKTSDAIAPPAQITIKSDPSTLRRSPNR